MGTYRDEADRLSRYPDGSLPNHFAHDVLGCPYECDDTHNHPEPCPELSRSEKSIELAARVVGFGIGVLIGVAVFYLVTHLL